MNLGVGRVLVIVALVAAGIVVLAKGFGGTGATVAASASPSATRTRSSPASATSTATPTESPSSTPAPRTKGVLFMVLNGTTVTGLGAAAEEMLTSHDYAAPVPAANAPTQGVKTTTVYYRPGQNEAQNKSDATYVSETYFPGSKVDKLGPAFDTIVPQAATIAIVVGEDFANKQAA